MRGILFDARVILPGMTGIGNYARNLLRAVPTGRIPIGILLPHGSPHANAFPGCRIHFTRIGVTSHPLTELYEQIALPVSCRIWGYEILVSFHGSVPLFHPGLRACAFVYDLAYVKVPGSHNLKYSLLLRVSQWIARCSATRLFTISEAVRAQLAETWGMSRDKISVVYPSDSGLKSQAPVPVPGVRPPYILAVSLTNKRKNLSNLLKGFALYRGGTGSRQLVLTGNAAWIAREMTVHGGEHTLNLGFVDESALRWLYENAQAFVYPSLDEGFGIPLLDAARFGCSVACSDIPVFREILAENAEYFDPSSPAQIAEALRKVDETPLRTNPEKLARFSWADSGRRLMKILCDLH